MTQMIIELGIFTAGMVTGVALTLAVLVLLVLGLAVLAIYINYLPEPAEDTIKCSECRDYYPESDVYKGWCRQCFEDKGMEFPG